MHKGETHTNGPKEEEIYDSTQDLIFKRWHRQTVKKKLQEDWPALKSG